MTTFGDYSFYIWASVLVTALLLLGQFIHAKRQLTKHTCAKPTASK